MTAALADAIGRLQEAQLRLAGTYATVAEEHAVEPDIFHLCRSFAEQTRSHADRLRPFAEGSVSEPGHGKGGLGLLHDLTGLFLLGQECWIRETIVRQAAQAAREKEVLDAVSACLEETNARVKWLKTRIKSIAAQKLTVG